MIWDKNINKTKSKVFKDVMEIQTIGVRTMLDYDMQLMGLQ